MTKRTRRRVKRNASNPIMVALHRAALLSPEERDQVKQPFRDALATFAAGAGDLAHWQVGADLCNMAEALAELRIGSNLTPQIGEAHDALAAIMARANAGHGWHVAGAELQALHEALVIYAAQVELCSYGEFLNAHELVRRRVSQAIAHARAGQVGRCLVHQRPGAPTEPDPQ